MSVASTTPFIDQQ